MIRQVLETYEYTTQEFLDKLKLTGIEINRIHIKMNGFIVVEIIKERIVE